MSSAKKAASKGKAGSPRKGSKAAALKDMAPGKRGSAVQGGKRTNVQDAHDKYA